MARSKWATMRASRCTNDPNSTFPKRGRKRSPQKLRWLAWTNGAHALQGVVERLVGAAGPRRGAKLRADLLQHRSDARDVAAGQRGPGGRRAAVPVGSLAQRPALYPAVPAAPRARPPATTSILGGHGRRGQVGFSPDGLDRLRGCDREMLLVSTAADTISVMVHHFAGEVHQTREAA